MSNSNRCQNGRAREAFKCEDVIAQLDRRRLLAVIAGAVAFAPAALAESARTKIADLADNDGVATAFARSSIGNAVSLRGYFAPGMRADVLFDLFEKPASPCPMCGFFHDAGASIAVIGAELPQGVSMLRAIDVSGKLAVETQGKAQLIAHTISVA